MSGAIPTTCHTLSWRRQEQLNFNFWFFSYFGCFFFSILLLFCFISELFFFLFSFIQFTNTHLCFPHPDCIHRCQLHLAVPCQLHLSQFQFCLPFLMHLHSFFRRPNSLFAQSWQQFLPKRCYPCARIHAVTFESTTVQQFNSTTVQQFNSTTVQQYNSSTVQQYNSTTVQQ